MTIDRLRSPLKGEKPMVNFAGLRVVVGGYNRRSRSAQDFPPSGKSNHDKVRGGLGAKPPNKEVQSKISVLVLFANIRRFSIAKNLLSRFVVLPASRLMMP